MPFLERQFRIQQTLDRFSPAAIFYSLVASLSRTDIHHYEHFLEEVRNYRNTLMSYLNNDRKIFSEHANEYFTQLDMDEIQNSQIDKRKENGTIFRIQNLPPLDLSGIPALRLQNLKLQYHMNDLITGILLLLTYSLVVFLICMNRFMKYDVR